MRPLLRSAVRLGLAIALVAGPALAKSTTCLAAVSGPAGVVEARFDDSLVAGLPPARTVIWTPAATVGETPDLRLVFRAHEDGSAGLLHRVEGGFDVIAFSDGEVVERAGGGLSESAFLARVSAELAERPYEQRLVVGHAAGWSMIDLSRIAERDVLARAAKTLLDKGLVEEEGAVCRTYGPYQVSVVGY